MYTLYKFHFLKRISEINQLFDDILIIWPAPVCVCVCIYVYIYIYIYILWRVSRALITVALETNEDHLHVLITAPHTSTARRTATGKHEHGTEDSHWRARAQVFRGAPITNPWQREAYIPEPLNKLTLRGIYLTPPCRVILHPVTLVENASRLWRITDKRTFFLFSFFSSGPFCFLFWVRSGRFGFVFSLNTLVVSPTSGDSSPDMEELLKHLTEVSIRQQQIVEHMAARQGESEREIAALRTAAAQRVPLPDPRVQATQLLPKMSAHDDVESYLMMFEAIATQEGWPREEWARVLAPLLTGEPQRAYFSTQPLLRESYDELRREIMGRVGLSPVSAAQQFHDWEFKTRLPARAQAADLTRLAHHWLLTGSPTATQVAEKVVIDRLLRALPRALRQAAGMRNLHTVGDLVEAIELAEATQHREVGERAPPFPRRVNQERRTLEGISRPGSRPAVPGPQDEPMPTEPPRSPNWAWLAGCIVHCDLPPEAPRVEVEVNGRPYPAILDSGSAVSLVQSTVVHPRRGTKACLSITCVHGDTRQVPARRVMITAASGSWPVEVGIIKDLPVPVLIGRDWPGFDRLLTAAMQPVSRAGNRQKRRSHRRPRRRPILLASDSTKDGESLSQTTNLFFDVYQQAKGGGGRSPRNNMGTIGWNIVGPKWGRSRERKCIPLHTRFLTLWSKTVYSTV